MSNGFNIGDFTITKREILASISIIAVMLLIGFLISGKISDYQMDKNEVYNKAVKINSTDLFQYGMDTNIGNAFVYGDLKAVDTVTYPEINGKYMSIEKVKEEYRKHYRTVTKTKTNSKGETEVYTEIEEYWTWDAVESWNKNCQNVTFLNIEFNYGDIYVPYKHYITTKDGGYHVRYVYYGSDASYTGTIFTTLKNNTINNTSFYNGKNIEETVEYLESDVLLVVFWIMWIIFICGCVYCFYYFDNRWLE